MCLHCRTCKLLCSSRRGLSKSSWYCPRDNSKGKNQSYSDYWSQTQKIRISLIVTSKVWTQEVLQFTLLKFGISIYLAHYILHPPPQNIATFRLFQSQTFLVLTNNISKNKLFQIEKVTYYNSWFHDKCTNIISMLLTSMITLLFVV